MTLYYYTRDKDRSVTCLGGCEALWPPVPLSGATMAPNAPSGVSGTFGADPIASGELVLTYNDWPLYTYHGDTSPGEDNGEGIVGEWFVATPSLAATPSGQ